MERGEPIVLMMRIVRDSVFVMPRGFVHPSFQHGGFLPRQVGLSNRNGGTATVWAVINAVGQVEPQQQ